jgi:uncharacterized membrane protein YdjX (TVP38/TMEM64 family)
MKKLLPEALRWSVVLLPLTSTLVIGEFFRSPLFVREFIERAGESALFVFLGIQIAQVVMAPFSNFFVGVAGGYVFGPWLGMVLSYIGWALGAALVYWIGGIIGMFFLPKPVQQAMNKVRDAIVNDPVLYLAALVVPGISDDIVVYIAGISRAFRFRQFMWPILVATAPGKFATAFFGAGVAGRDMWFVLIYVAIIGAVFLYGWHKYRVNHYLQAIKTDINVAVRSSSVLYRLMQYFCKNGSVLASL